MDGRVVERAVRLDVTHPRPGRPAHAFQRTDLVDDVVGQLAEIHVDEPAPEPGEIAVAHLRPDDDAALRAPAQVRRSVEGSPA